MTSFFAECQAIASATTRRAGRSMVVALLAVGGGAGAGAQPSAVSVPTSAAAAVVSAASEPLQSIGELDVPRYTGTWYQVAWFPNRFQRQCASDTQARYTARSDGRLDVLNQCRESDGKISSADGLARPVGSLKDGRLKPAQLEVSFLPAALRWTGIGWGRYWVIDLPADYRYAVVSEPSREYLWVLSRTPALAAGDRERIRERVQALGFDLARWVDHPHTMPTSAR